jgi:DNA-binding MarR family transcriptional regulator
MPNTHKSKDLNVVGALAVALGDRMDVATAQAAGAKASMPAALVSLEGWAGGQPIAILADALGVSHSRAVRLVDRLAEAGLARRRIDPTDGRAALVEPTAAGRRAARRVLAARAAVLESALAPLAASDRAALGELAARVLDHMTSGRSAARRTCRLCDTGACGHFEGRCPVTAAADRAAAVLD